LMSFSFVGNILANTVVPPVARLLATKIIEVLCVRRISDFRSLR